ncbi:MAG: hypothetical protein QW837_06740, partial [Conexivisphaerales archaeon]
KEAGLKVEKPISWDTNLLDGYDGERHHSINLKEIYTIHRTYELKRRIIQRLPELKRNSLIQFKGEEQGQ